MTSKHSAGDGRGQRTLALRLLILVCCILCVGCKSLNQFDVAGEFEGVSASLARSDVVSVLIVHGMGGFSNDDPASILRTIDDKLPVEPSGQTLTRPICKDGRRVGVLERDTFTSVTGSKVLYVYTLHWAPATARVKANYVGYDGHIKYAKQRLAINNNIKQWLVNQNLADVALYLGVYKPDMQFPIERSIEWMHTDTQSTGSRRELVLISFSLGSKMLLDVVQKMRQSDEQATRQAAERLTKDTSSFFMLANQLPLLALGDFRHPGSSEPRGTPPVATPDSLRNFADQRLGFAASPEARDVPAEFSIVAISDPNDLLSFPIPQFWADEYPDTFVNVTVNIARTGVYIPTQGWLADPVKAHTGHGQDERILDLILFGSP